MSQKREKFDTFSLKNLSKLIYYKTIPSSHIRSMEKNEFLAGAERRYNKGGGGEVLQRRRKPEFLGLAFFPE